jgi:hypothetical protein
MQMPSSRFWEIIDLGRAQTKPSGASVNPRAMEKILGTLTDTEVLEFMREFYQGLITLNKWEVWGAGYVIDGGMSDDSFHYFRSWIIGKGQEVFETALSSPDDLGKFVQEHDELDNEELEYVAIEVLESRDLEDPRDEFEENADQDPTGQMFDEETVEMLYPKLAAKFA